jgi:hypothetical protein
VDSFDELPHEIDWPHGFLTLRRAEPVVGVSVASTTETRERYAFLKTKRQGTTWQEGRLLYRNGPTGVTVFDTDKWL